MIKSIKQHNISIKLEENAWWLEDPLFNIILCCNTPELLMTEYQEELEFLIDTYAKEDNSKLTEKAIELKNNIIEYIDFE